MQPVNDTSAKPISSAKRTTTLGFALLGAEIVTGFAPNSKDVEASNKLDNRRIFIVIYLLWDKWRWIEWNSWDEFSGKASWA